MMKSDQILNKLRVFYEKSGELHIPFYIIRIACEVILNTMGLHFLYLQYGLKISLWLCIRYWERFNIDKVMIDFHLGAMLWSVDC